MATYLLTWNPIRSPWDELPALASEVKQGSSTTWFCSCSNSKRIAKGDRVFMICLGQEPKGIFASGSVIKGSHYRKHWNRVKAKKGEKSLFVQVKFDILLDPEQDPIFDRKQLDVPPFDKVHWNSQSSGITITNEVAIVLEAQWSKFVGALPDEIADTGSLYEGAVKRISVNAYERSLAARQKCVSVYGTRCSVCQTDLEDIYGEAGRNLIHVHHLKPLSEIGRGYKIDPVLDLRPICPNCHAIIHRRVPAYTVKEVAEFVERAKRRRTSGI